MTDDWKLVWSDEFDTDGPPDPAKWSPETGFVRNRELQYFTDRPENLRVENGHLVIEARREDFPNAANDPGAEDWRRQWPKAEVTSASIHTQDKYKFVGGRVEVRAKIPEGLGIWPAIWLLGSKTASAGWPECGEIDIMEYVGHTPHTVHGSVHMAKYNHVRGNHQTATLEMPDLHEDFHVFAVEWTQERIDGYVDGRHFFRFENEGTGSDAWPFDRPHHIKLNLSFGGGWGAQKGLDWDCLPQQFLVDYVRVYQPES